MPFPKANVCTLLICAVIAVVLQGCGAAANNNTVESQSQSQAQTKSQPGSTAQLQSESQTQSPTESQTQAPQSETEPAESSASPSQTSAAEPPAVKHMEPAEARARLNITEDYRDQFMHGEKTAAYQKYIVMHDTEGEAEASSVIEWWANNGNLVSSHFVVNKDGSIVQCVPLDIIAHHAGYGDTGHNEQFGVTDESRDDRKGTTPIGDWVSDYGMNSYSVGIEMVHSGAVDDDYPEAQLKAVDNLIAYIDSYYGFQSVIIDHNDWRTGNSDCSEAFQKYLENYRTSRTHDGSALQ